jgi:hypothetical protein
MLSLPSEVIGIILQNAGSRRDLKHVRLSCKRLASIGAECLFKEVTVVPHEDSFEQLLKLSDHPTISKYVKSLVYDTRTISTPEDVQLDINADPIRKLYWETPTKRLYLRSFLKYHDEHTFRTVEETGHELRYFLRIFESLPSLKAIKITNGEGHGVEVARLPRFYERMRNHMGKDHARYFSSTGKITHRTRSVLLCAYVSGLELENLQLQDVKWVDFFTFREVREVSRYVNVLSKTLSRRLVARCAHKPGFQVWAQGMDTEVETVAVLTQAVDSLLTLKSLDLRFGNSNVSIWMERSEDRSMLWDLALPRDLPKLQVLKLSWFTATEDDLVDFILGNSPTLTSLTIQHARLLKKLGQPRACWVDVIRRLQQGLRLEKACLEGVLSNGGKQYWHASASHQDKMEANGLQSLKGSIEQFLVHGGRCPLYPTIVPGVVNGPTNQVLWLGDESFCLHSTIGAGDDDS